MPGRFFSQQSVIDAITGNTPPGKKSSTRKSSSSASPLLDTPSRFVNGCENEILERILAKMTGWEMQLTITKSQDEHNTQIKLLFDKLTSIENVVNEIGNNMSSLSGKERVTKKVP